MRRTVKRLTAREVLNAKPDRDRRALMLCDGDGLYLQVSRDRNDHTNIRRSWVFRYEYLGRRHDIGLGPLRHLDLAEARKQARKKRQQIIDGIDPFTAKRQLMREELDRLAAEKRATTFRQCAEQCIADHEDGWKNPKHRAQWRATLKTYAYPVLGDLAVDCHEPCCQGSRAVLEGEARDCQPGARPRREGARLGDGARFPIG